MAALRMVSIAFLEAAGTARGSDRLPLRIWRFRSTTSPQGRIAVEGLIESASNLVRPKCRARRSRVASRGAICCTSSMPESASSSQPFTSSTRVLMIPLARLSPVMLDS
ncbi:hypothetical protein D3C78_1387770 [compost metagenome]